MEKAPDEGKEWVGVKAQPRPFPKGRRSFDSKVNIK